MSTLTKLFTFISDSEGWTPTPYDSTFISMYWAQGRKKGNRDINPILVTAPGALITTVRRGSGSSSSDNVWILTATPESMGVPVGSTITSIAGSFLARWMFKSNGPQALSEISLAGDDFNAGPLELLNFGSLVGELAGSISGPYRDGSSDPYRYYPTANPPDNPVVDESSAFIKSSGVQFGLSIASNATLSYRLRILTPEIDLVAGRSPPLWGRIKVDRIKLVFTYTIPFTQPQMGFYGAF